MANANDLTKDREAVLEKQAAVQLREEVQQDIHNLDNCELSGFLVKRIRESLADGDFTCPWDDKARAIIREVAAWLRESKWPGSAEELEWEANRTFSQ